LIVRSNYPFINPDGVSSTPNLTPLGNGFGVSVNNLSVTQSDIDLEIASLSNVPVINQDIDKKIRLQSILLLAGPSDDRFAKFAFLSLQSADLDLLVTDPINFNIIPSQNQSEMIGNYSQNRAFLAVITLDESNNPVNHSSTFYG
jgi:hypothetical protein